MTTDFEIPKLDVSKIKPFIPKTPKPGARFSVPSLEQMIKEKVEGTETQSSSKKHNNNNR